MWDDVANAKIVRPFKLHKRERDREDRYATCLQKYLYSRGTWPNALTLDTQDELGIIHINNVVMSCRFKKIQEALKGMDAKIEAHREVRSVSLSFHHIWIHQFYMSPLILMR